MVILNVFLIPRQEICIQKYTFLFIQGTVKQRAFENLQVKSCPTELFARELFRKRDVEHYWDMAYSGAIMESVGEPTD